MGLVTDSPSNSVGSAGGGGCPVGAAWMGFVFTEIIEGVGGLLGNDQPHNQVCQKDAMSSLA